MQHPEKSSDLQACPGAMETDDRGNEVGAQNDWCGTVGPRLKVAGRPPPARLGSRDSWDR
jgi:hypothetical protein